MRVLLVAGARPNFMKVAPVVAELDRRGIDNVLVHTGQHYDPAMSDVFFAELGIRAPEHHLDVGSGSHAVQTGRVMERFEPVLEAVAPDRLVVVGDVNSTLACALVGAKGGVPVAHVEAGLRSGDWSMPEEVNRVVTDRISDVLLAPSADAVENLRSEGVPDERIALVGNVMADTLLTNLERARARGRTVLADIGVSPGGYALLTLHRPSNVDVPSVFAGIMAALATIGAERPVVWPVHPRARGALGEVPAPPGVVLVEPVGYLDSIALQAGAAVVLTDSGGVQEETTVLGVPCLTLRTTTERPITIEQGTNRLTGVEPEAIIAGYREAVADVAAGAGDGAAPARPPLWDGRTAERIVDRLVAAAGSPSS